MREPPFRPLKVSQLVVVVSFLFTLFLSAENLCRQVKRIFCYDDEEFVLLFFFQSLFDLSLIPAVFIYLEESEWMHRPVLTKYGPLHSVPCDVAATLTASWLHGVCR